MSTDNLKREFFEFFGATDYPGKIEQITEEDRNIFIVPYSTELRRVKTIYGTLPYEFYLNHIEKLDTLVKKLMEDHTIKETCILLNNEPDRIKKVSPQILKRFLKKNRL